MTHLTVELDLLELMDNKLTYPSWSTSTVYPINCSVLSDNEISVFYEINGPVRRRVSRRFPRFIKLEPNLIWLLGFLNGEGSNSICQSNYRRFTVTNKNPALIKLTIEYLHNISFIDKHKLSAGCFHIIHAKEITTAIQYWSESLSLPEPMFKLFHDVNKTSRYGVCHFYLSDVLLRRVVDELNNHFMSGFKDSHNRRF